MFTVFFVGLFTSCFAVDPPVFITEDIRSDEGKCVDNDIKCSIWASQGECQTNAVWMMGNCRRACQSCQGGDRAWKLRTHIATSYDNNKNNNNNTKKYSINSILVHSVRLNHVEMDESKQIMRVHGKIVMTWNDSRVVWDEKQWGVSWLNFYWIHIWTPQIVQTNGANALPGMVTGKVLSANYTGQVFMWADFSFSAPCPFDYSAYPNDRQMCCFKLDDKRYLSVRFKVTEETIRLTSQSVDETHMSGWKVERVDVKENNYVVKLLSDWRRDPFDVATTNCDICVTVHRQAVSYGFELVTPTLVTVVLTMISFLVGDFGRQVHLLIASLGLQLVTLLLISARLPTTVNRKPTILKFSGFNMITTTIMLLLTLLLQKLGEMRSELPSPRIVDQLLSLLSRFLPSPLLMDSQDKLTITETNGESVEPRRKQQYLSLALALRCIIFIFFTLIYILVIFACFVV